MASRIIRYSDREFGIDVTEIYLAWMVAGLVMAALFLAA